MEVLSHPKPMKRHTKHVVSAVLGVHANTERGQLRIVLTFQDGATQSIFLSRDAAKEFAILAKVAAAGL